jgi:hypothetical protein
MSEPVTTVKQKPKTGEVTIERVERALAILTLLERLDGPLAYVPIHTTLLLELVALRAERDCARRRARDMRA